MLLVRTLISSREHALHTCSGSVNEWTRCVARVLAGCETTSWQDPTEVRVNKHCLVAYMASADPSALSTKEHTQNTHLFVWASGLQIMSQIRNRLFTSATLQMQKISVVKQLKLHSRHTYTIHLKRYIDLDQSGLMNDWAFC